MGRILFIAHLNDLSGAQRALLDVIDAVDRGRFAPEAVCPAEGPFSAALAERGVPFAIIPTPLEALCEARGLGRRLALARKRFAYIRAIRRQIRRVRPDLVYVNSVVNVYAGVAARLAGSRLIWHIHEIFPPTRLNRLKYFTAERCADALAAPSLATAAMFGRRAKRRFHVLSNGVDCVRFSGDQGRRAAARDRLGIPAGEVAVGTIGYLTPRKGVDVFLDAAELARRSGARLRFHIIGPPDANAGGYVAGLREFVNARGMAEAVKFAGESNNVEEWLAALDVFVLASRSENAPRVILEAMASGAAILATDVGGVSELVEDRRQGRLVPSEDARGLSAAILELAGDPEMRLQLGRAARERAVNEFSLDRFRRNVRELMDAVYQP